MYKFAHIFFFRILQRFLDLTDGAGAVARFCAEVFARLQRDVQRHHASMFVRAYISRGAA